MQRRLFLRQFGMGATAVWLGAGLLSSCNKEPLEGFENLEDTENEPVRERSTLPLSVIVIGAGAAGMYAASWLKAKGATVTILESSERRGGRIKSVSGFADFPIEAGAELIHGNNSMWYQWATQQGGQFVGGPFADFYMLDGQLKTEAQAAADADVQAAWDFVDAATSYAGVDKTVAQHLATTGIPPRVHHIINADLGNDYGTDNSRLSIKGITEEDNLWTAGNQDYLLKNRSFAQVLDTKCANILSSIVYNKKVVRVEYDAAKPKVKTHDNVWYEADAVIVTVPLTILQQGDITFSPALPAWKANAIQKIGMGAGLKIMLKFSQRFWNANLRYLYGDQNAPMFWYSSRQRGSSHVLTAFIMGPKAELLSAQGAAAATTVVNELNQFYGNNVASNSLLASHIEDWTTNPHIRGAYSFAKPNGGGVASRKNVYTRLANKVFFAGEATNYKGHNSTVHGAIESGFWAAKDVWNYV